MNKRENFSHRNKKNFFNEQKQIKINTIILECKSFYQTFLDISIYFKKPLYNPENNVFDTQVSEKICLYQFSYVVNGAFATELAMKYLLSLSEIDFSKGSKGHDLLYLYNLFFTNKNKISDDREEIIRRLVSKNNQTEETIIENIKSWNDCYNRYRYCFSYDAVGYNGFFSEFVNTVCLYAIEKSNLLKKEDDDSLEIQIQTSTISD